MRMKIGDLITINIFSDIKGIDNGNRLYLRKKYGNIRKCCEDWLVICSEENITIKK